MSFVASWLDDIEEFVRLNSYGPAAFRCIEYDQVTYGILDPYGYYIINANGSIYLVRQRNIAIRFHVVRGQIATGLVRLQNPIGQIDALFTHPPPTATQITKFILYPGQKGPKRFTAIQLINRCLDMRILELREEK